MQELEVNVLAGLVLLGLWDVEAIIAKLAFFGLRPRSTRDFCEVQQGEYEVFVNLDCQLLEQDCEVLDVQHTVRIIFHASNSRVQDRMSFHLLARFRYNTGVDDNWEDAAVKLVVDLDPLDSRLHGLIQRRLGVLQLNVPQGHVNKLLQLAIDERNANSSQPKLRCHCDVGILFLDFETRG